MSREVYKPSSPRIKKAVKELKGLITARYPQATFSVAAGEDPEGIYLRTTVDVPDTEEVLDVVIDRMLEMEIDEGLPIYVLPVPPLERVAEQLARPITAKGKQTLPQIFQS